MIASAGAIGATLRLARSVQPGMLLVAGRDDDEASEHRVYADLDKRGAFATLAGSGRSASRGFLMPAPAGPVVYLRLVAANCCGEGPR